MLLQIIFEAVVGDGFMSDIAVDDIEMHVKRNCSRLPDEPQQQGWSVLEFFQNFTY